MSKQMEPLPFYIYYTYSEKQPNNPNDNIGVIFYDRSVMGISAASSRVRELNASSIRFAWYSPIYLKGVFI